MNIKNFDNLNLNVTNNLFSILGSSVTYITCVNFICFSPLVFNINGTGYTNITIDRLITNLRVINLLPTTATTPVNDNSTVYCNITYCQSDVGENQSMINIKSPGPSAKYVFSGAYKCIGTGSNIGLVDCPVGPIFLSNAILITSGATGPSDPYNIVSNVNAVLTCYNTCMGNKSVPANVSFNVATSAISGPTDNYYVSSFIS